MLSYRSSGGIPLILSWTGFETERSRNRLKSLGFAMADSGSNTALASRIPHTAMSLTVVCRPMPIHASRRRVPRSMQSYRRRKPANLLSGYALARNLGDLFSEFSKMLEPSPIWKTIQPIEATITV
jgi:hypothetical protein